MAVAVAEDEDPLISDARSMLNLDSANLIRKIDGWIAELDYIGDVKQITNRISWGVTGPRNVSFVRDQPWYHSSEAVQQFNSRVKGQDLPEWRYI